MTERVRYLLLWSSLAVGSALALAGLDPVGAPFSGLLGYLVVSAIGFGAVGLALWATGDGSVPRSVLVALLLALLLRLALGIGLFKRLPVAGYDTKAQQLGYVYYDAYTRDTDAYARGRSDQPLASAFLDRRSSDQYGGLLYLSAGVYRYLSDGPHRPLLVVVLAASISSLAVLFTWGFVGMTLGGRVGALAAWIVAIYPDYVLIGSSQMREAFIVPSVALVLFGYARTRIGARGPGAAAILLGLLGATFVSPPFGVVALALLALFWVLENRGKEAVSRWLVAGLVLAAVLTVGLTIWAWSGQPDARGGIGWLGQRLVEVPRFQLQRLEEGSGWVQKLFEVTPNGLHMPMAVAYGLTQPFLPAALGDNSGLPLWRGLALFRALGWFALLPALLYAPYGVYGAKRRRLLLAMLLIGWGGALLGSYWAAGDLWDNPRYRIVVLPIQAAVVAWAVFHSRHTGDPWLKRIFVLVLGWCAIFLQWYAGRYYGSPSLELEATLALGLGLSLAYLTYSILRDRRGSEPG